MSCFLGRLSARLPRVLWVWLPAAWMNRPEGLDSAPVHCWCWIQTDLGLQVLPSTEQMNKLPERLYDVFVDA